MTGRPVRARLMVRPGVGADLSWFAIAGQAVQPPQTAPSAVAEWALPVAGTATVDVAVKVPEKAPAGSFSSVVGAALEEAPDQVVSGPTVAFHVPEAKKRKFPWWILIVAMVGLLLVGGGILIWNLTRPTAAWSKVNEGSYEAFGGMDFDLDGGGEDLDGEEGGADVRFSSPWFSNSVVGVSGSAFAPGARVSIAEDATVGACESAPDYDDDEKQSILLPVDEFTVVCVRFTDEGRMAAMRFFPADMTGNSHTFVFVVWEDTA
ncbi:hypothetical protein ACPW96_19155 [Micromonospora sp. DT81.3]|uniref:hypothetical protein n=1 Tax=Micromonospora sp. DT81.3 TaxID=3416523 RepID=UPI003CF18F6A